MARSQPAPDPLHDHRGARRLKVGESGRLHLDRNLPFLVLHRRRMDDEPAASIARRVALNSPAYLIWDEGRDDAAAIELLVELTEELGEPGMPLLVMALDDLIQPPEGEASPALTPFVATVAGGKSAREHRARDVLIRSLEGIEIDLRHPTVISRSLRGDHWLVSALEGLGDQSDPMLISLPQIHRRDGGGVYPQIAHELAVACGDALLRTACAYLDDSHGRAPDHYRSLGRSAFLSAALDADRKLGQVAASFDFLLSVSPINTTTALEKFIADGEKVAPVFNYRPLTVDPDAIKRRLYRLDFARLEDPLLERLLSDKRHEIDAQLTMLATRNTRAFAGALFLYGTVGRAARGCAADPAVAPAFHHSGKAGDGVEIASAARDLIGSYNRKDAIFDATIEVRDDVGRLLVCAGRLLSAGHRDVRSRVDALLAHEITIHLLTFFNGAAQGLSIFRSGLANYEGVQEGLGVFAEWAVGGCRNPECGCSRAASSRSLRCSRRRHSSRSIASSSTASASRSRGVRDLDAGASLGRVGQGSHLPQGFST